MPSPDHRRVVPRSEERARHSDAATPGTTRPDHEAVVITGATAVSAFGHGAEALFSGVMAGLPAFAPVTRFDVSGRRVTVGALASGSPILFDELTTVIAEACEAAGLTAAHRSAAPLLLAAHGDPDLGRSPVAERPGHYTGAFAAAVAEKSGLADTVRAYTSACVAASTAVADASSLISRGVTDRVVVAAGYLVEPDQFALFDAGRALAADGAVRPFSIDRKGVLLGDGVAAIVLESAAAAAARGAEPLARLTGWGRAGDAYHVCQPRPDGDGLARAITAALGRAGLTPDRIGYVNAHGSGSPQSDAAEANALLTALAGHSAPVSSTKSLHGQSLEASPLLELIICVEALRHGRLPVNAGYLGADPDCPLDIVLGAARAVGVEHVLSTNVAFGGANTALVVSAP